MTNKPMTSPCAGHGFRFSAAPVKVTGMGSFPVRAYAVVGDRVTGQ